MNDRPTKTEAFTEHLRATEKTRSIRQCFCDGSGWVLSSRNHWIRCLAHPDQTFARLVEFDDNAPVDG